MYNPTLERLKAQIIAARPIVVNPVVVVQEYEVTLSPPVSLDRLRALLIEALDIKEGHLVQRAAETEYKFSNLWEFVEWYSQHKFEFSEQQQRALDTIVQARDSLFGGCRCTYATRETMAREYYADFWRNNKATDLPATVLKILGTSKVTFEGLYTYPEPLH